MYCVCHSSVRLVYRCRGLSNSESTGSYRPRARTFMLKACSRQILQYLRNNRVVFLLKQSLTYRSRVTMIEQFVTHEEVQICSSQGDTTGARTGFEQLITRFVHVVIEFAHS